LQLLIIQIKEKKSPLINDSVLKFASPAYSTSQNIFQEICRYTTDASPLSSELVLPIERQSPVSSRT